MLQRTRHRARFLIAYKGWTPLSEPMKKRAPRIITSAAPPSPAASWTRFAPFGRAPTGDPCRRLAEPDGQCRQHGDRNRRPERHDEGGEHAGPPQTLADGEDQDQDCAGARADTDSEGQREGPSPRPVALQLRGGRKMRAHLAGGVMMVIVMLMMVMPVMGWPAPCAWAGQARCAAGSRAAMRRPAATSPQLAVSSQPSIALVCRPVERSNSYQDPDQRDRRQRLHPGGEERQEDATPHRAAVGQYVGGDHRLPVAGAGGVQHAVEKADGGEEKSGGQGVRGFRPCMLEPQRRCALPPACHDPGPHPLHRA